MAGFSSIDAAAGYVAGIIDGEGSVSVGVKHRAIRVGNTDPVLLDAFQEALAMLGVQSTRTQRGAKNDRCLPIEVVSIFGRRNLEVVLEHVPIRAPEKVRRLNEAVASFVLPNYRRKHEVTREQLEVLVERGLTQREIASELGMTRHSNAQYHLEKHGLTTRRACGLL